jgi:CBS domain-containing protein
MCNKYQKTYTDSLNSPYAVDFLNQFRAARAMALRDAEAFHDIIIAIEKLGFAETMGGYPPDCVTRMKNIANGIQDIADCNKKPKPVLNTYSKPLSQIAELSALASYIPSQHQTWHSSFSDLFETVREGRNDAMHQGVFARNLTNHSVQLALILEDALMSGLSRVSDFMVREPVCAHESQPVSFARQQMLANSFSYLPIKIGENWHLISDYSVARFLRTFASQKPASENAPSSTAVESANQERKQRLSMLLRDAIEMKPDIMEEAETVAPGEAIQEVVKKVNGKPLLVIEHGRLVGVLTSYDLL